MGALVAAEFAVAVGDLSTFAGPHQLAAYAGLAPVARDSGKRSGNLERPSATIVHFAAPSSWLRSPRSASKAPAVTSTNANGPKAAATTKP